MLLKTWLVGCHPVPGDPRLNAFYTPLQNHMTSDLPPWQTAQEKGGTRGWDTLFFVGGGALKLIRVYICDPNFQGRHKTSPRPGKHIREKNGENME